MKSRVGKMKNMLGEIGSRLDSAEEKMNVLGATAIEITQNKTQRGK